MEKKKGIAVLGSTGSIGKQTLDVIDQLSDFFFVSVLSAMSNAELLIEQALKFKPNTVIIGDESKYQLVQDSLFKHDIKVYAGQDALEQIVGDSEIDIVLNAIVGFAGLQITINTIKHKKILALANKESLVIAGDYIQKLYISHKARIIPVDSEQSAIFQCIAGEYDNTIEKIILTASGGPFLNSSTSFLENVSVSETLNHPKWKMGNKVSVDSATMINKGFELIETKWLYDVDVNQIEISVHPEAIIHSMVQFEDGNIKAQLAYPDMRIAIQYALSFPKRIKNNFNRLDFSKIGQLNFQKPDLSKFPNLGLAIDTIKLGGNMPCILNAGNEIAVEAFLKNQINFSDIYRINENCLERIGFVKNPTIDDYIETDKETRIFAKKIIG